VPIPNLLHPVPVTIEPIDRASTSFDEDAGEPIQAATRAAAVTVPGQVRWTSRNELRMQLGGPVENADGYVTFRFVDLRAAGVTDLKINDRITRTGSTVVEVYITKLEPFAHHPDQGGPTLLKAWFKDRSPAKTRG